MRARDHPQAEDDGHRPVAIKSARRDIDCGTDEDPKQCREAFGCKSNPTLLAFDFDFTRPELHC